MAEINAPIAATEQPEPFGEIVGVDVFRPGTWHGRTYTNEDMQVIAANSNMMLPYFRAKLKWADDAPRMHAAERFSVKLGHDPASHFFRQAALGISTQYYTKVLPSGETRVFADFRNVPDVLCKAIANHFPERSVEKYQFFRHPDTNELIPDVISAVAFLGAIPPEVKALSDEYKVLFEETHADPPIELFDWRGVLTQPVAANAPGQALTNTQEGKTMNPEMIAKMKAMFLDGKSVEEIQAAFPEMPPGDLAKLIEEWQPEKTAKKVEEKAEEKAQDEAAQDQSDGNQTPVPLHPQVILGILSMFVKNKPIEEIRAAFPDVAPENLVQLIEGWQKGQNAAAFKKDEQAAEQMQAGTSPQVFSESDVRGMIADVVQKFEAQLKDRDVQVQQIVAEKRRADLTRWYEDRKRDGLPASFDSFSPVAFMERLSDEKQVFAEGQTAQSSLEVFQAVLAHAGELVKVTKGEKAAHAGMVSINTKEQRDKAVADVMNERGLEQFNAMKVVAESHPEWFTEGGK